MAETREKKRCEIRRERTGVNGLPPDVNYFESAVRPPHPTCVYLQNNKFIKEENVTPTEGPNAEFSIEPEPLVVINQTEMFEKSELNEFLVKSKPSFPESCKSRLGNHNMKDRVPNYKGPFKCEHCPKFFALKTNIIRHYTMDHPPEKVVNKNLTDSRIDVVMRKRVIKKDLDKYLILPETNIPVPVIDKEFSKQSELNDLMDVVKSEPASPESCKSSPERHVMRKNNNIPDYKGPLKCEHCNKFFALKTNFIRHYTMCHPPETVVKNETDSDVAMVTREMVNITKKLEQQKDFIVPESDPDDRSDPVKSELNELVNAVKSEPSHINLEDEIFTIEENKVKSEALNAELINMDLIKGEPSPEPSYINLEDDKLTIEENNMKAEAPNAELDITDPEPVGIENKPEMVGSDDPHPVVVDRNQPEKVECDIKGKGKCPRKTVYCELCDKHFKFHYLYKRHQTVHSDKKPFSCDICSKAFKRKDWLLSHIENHSDNKQFTCDICDAKFKWKYNLVPHIKCHSDSRPFTCEICNIKFQRKRYLATHMKYHSDSRPFTCNICNVKFKYKYSLSKHMTTHCDNRPFTCVICNDKFKCKSNLATHMKTHSDSRPFTCDICNVKFKWKSNLATHMKTHCDNRPFTCDICSMKFKRNRELATHMKTHSDSRPFTCDICNIKFQRKHYLATHIKTHRDDRPFTCEICNDQFKRKVHLTDHMTTHSDDRPFTCDICNVKFKRKYNLARHRKCHTENKQHACPIFVPSGKKRRKSHFGQNLFLTVS